MIEALRIRDFRLLWLARSVSQLGTWLLVVAAPAYVFELTGSIAATGLTMAAEFLPYGITVLGGSTQIGLVISALGVGFLIGAPVMRALVDRVPPGGLLGVAPAVTGGGFVGLFTSSALPLALGMAVVIGVAGSVTLGATQTTLQRATPDEVLGRTSAAMFTAEAAATLFGALAGPALAEASSITWTAVASGATAALTGLLALVLLRRA